MSDPKAMPRNLLNAIFHPWIWRMAWRDSRSQRVRLVVFSLAIVSGIAALTAIHSLKASVEKGIGAEAKALLGSDLRVSSKNDFSDGEVAGLSENATRASRETSFPSMMRFLPKGGTRLMQVRGMGGGYPFYGKVDTRPGGRMGETAGGRRGVAGAGDTGSVLREDRRRGGAGRDQAADNRSGGQAGATREPLQWFRARGLREAGGCGEKRAAGKKQHGVLRPPSGNPGRRGIAAA